MLSTKHVTWIFIGVISVLVIVNLYSVLTINTLTHDLQTEAEEYARAAEIQILSITDASCADCYDIGIVVETIKNANVDVLSEEEIPYTEETAQGLIEKYSLEKIPAVIVTGEITKEGADIPGGVLVDDALVFENQNPVYLELATWTYRGRIQTKIITNTECEECYDLSSFVEALQTFMSISHEEVLDMKDASQEIETYALTELPAVIISGDLELYSDTLEKLEALGSYVGKELVLTAKLNPPYWDLEAEEIQGLVTVTYLTDESCADCYNVNVHKTVLENYGVYIAEEITVDISGEEGQDLVEEYNITKVPTVVVSEELKYYEGISGIWERVGTIEEDGAYVFRELDLVSEKYTDLEKE